jgi:membrane dipeptidase
MNLSVVRILSITLCILWASHELLAQDSQSAEPIVVTERAKQLHESAMLFDGHNDLPWAFRTFGMPSFDKRDIAKPQSDMQTDIPRLRKGGVKAQFWSVYVPSDSRQQGQSLLLTLEQIDLVHRMIARYPETFELALTADDVERISKSGRIASMIGMEGGHSIENSLSVLRQLYDQGARYMTLTHSESLDWADSATDDQPHNGLTPFGERVVEEMNRLGMLVDISHVSIATMNDAIRVSKAPVIFSHSSARAIADHPRNVPDDVLRLTAKNGGVVMVNFYPSFVVPSAAKRSVERSAYKKQLTEDGLPADEIDQLVANWENSHPVELGSIYTVVDHIDHIAKVAGIDHVGIGSDYDGIDVVPDQLEDVSTYPRITQVLINRGYSDDDIRKILGGNILRVLRDAEKVAAGMTN